MHCNRKAYFLVSATFRFQKGIEKNVHTPETYFKYQSYVPGSRNSLVSSVLAYWNWCPGQISLIKRNTKKIFLRRLPLTRYLANESKSNCREKFLKNLSFVIDFITHVV